MVLIVFPSVPLPPDNSQKTLFSMELLSNEEMVHFKTVHSVFFFIDYLEIQEHSFWKEILMFCFFLVAFFFLNL